MIYREKILKKYQSVRELWRFECKPVLCTAHLELHLSYLAANVLRFTTALYMVVKVWNFQDMIIVVSMMIYQKIRDQRSKIKKFVFALRSSENYEITSTDPEAFQRGVWGVTPQLAGRAAGAARPASRLYIYIFFYVATFTKIRKYC